MFTWGGLLQVALRWIHFVGGIIWIGHLYFFNFVNVNVAKTYDAETKKKVVPELMPRALFWFRVGAMVTFISGWLLLLLLIHLGVYSATDGSLMDPMQSPRLAWIILGAAFGSVMWYNVWFVIWPNQKKIIGWTKKGEAPPEMAALVAQAGKRSRINTYLSIPLLAFMSLGAHADLLGGFNWIAAIVITIIGVLWAMRLIKQGTTVGQWKE